MSLTGVARTVDNATMHARAVAAIRQAGADHAQDKGASGTLAAQALIDPGSLAAHFLARLATNPTVAQASCTDCGYAAVDDGAITYVVEQAWADIAKAVHPTA